LAKDSQIFPVERQGFCVWISFVGATHAPPASHVGNDTCFAAHGKMLSAAPRALGYNDAASKIKLNGENDAL
jgi:hypothetical protein